MNHKRGRPKSRRAGCLLCKPHKANGCTSKGHRREEAKLRKQDLSDADYREYDRQMQRFDAGH
jgi:hypothetical protein